MGDLKKYQIKNKTDDVLFAGFYKSVKDCVEAAVLQNINLNHADLSFINLAQANLDDAQMIDVDFTNTNLNGANLSEGQFDGSDFTNADVSFACFAMSSLCNANFTNASFGSTDVQDAIITGCQFSCPSVFTTQFHRAEIFENCLYMHDSKGAMTLSKPPISVVGLSHDIVYLDRFVKIGNDFVMKGDLLAAGDRHLQFIYGSNVASFLQPVLYENTAFL